MNACHRMIESIRKGFARTESWTRLAAPAPAVLDVMARVPRDRFVPADLVGNAWEDRALGIGYGATISQPFIVALMTTLLRVGRTDRVLEVGSGSGYQAAILAELADRVFSLEIVPQLRFRSQSLLAELGYENAEVLHGDGWNGLPAEAPFDVIVVTACAEQVPAELREQLAVDGRMVVPIGSGDSQQDLFLLEKGADGETSKRLVLPVTFVPMVGRGSP